MKQSHRKEMEWGKHRCTRFCLNSGTAQSLMLFTAFTRSLLRELSVVARKLSQKVMKKLCFSFASYCSGSVTSKVTTALWAVLGDSIVSSQLEYVRPLCMHVCATTNTKAARRRRVMCRLIQNLLSQ